VKILSCGEQSVSSDEEENVSDNSNTQPDVWANSGAEQPHFPFTGKPGINVDLHEPSNPFLNIFKCSVHLGTWKVRCIGQGRSGQ
jgi:hypothetical protein